MSYAAALQQHYTQVSLRLNDILTKKLPWHTPSVMLEWWTPQITPINIHIPGLPVVLEVIAFGVTHEHGIPWETIVSTGRHGPAMRARQNLYYYALRDTEMSSNCLAKYFRRDHSTIIKGAQAYAKRHNLPLARPQEFRIWLQPMFRRRTNKGRFSAKEIAGNDV